MRRFATSSKIEANTKSMGKPAFDAQAFLDSAGVARKVLEYRKSQLIYSQGDPATSVIYIQKGVVKITVVNTVGKEAVVAILSAGDFLGEGCMTGQTAYIGTATTMTSTTVLTIGKSEMIRVIHDEHAFSDRFISHLLGRNIRIEEDLVDQLFNSTEKRLARTLLLLARYSTQDQPQKLLPKVTQEMLAEMIGASRPRVNFFMSKFKKLGFISYNRGLHINNSLLRVVLHE